MKKRGFTLIEVIIAVGIITLLSAFLGTMGKDLFFNNYFVQRSLVAQEEGRRALKDMVKEIRTITYADNGAYPIEAAATSSLTVYSDLDADGHKERIRYFLDGRTFKKGVIEPSGVPAVYATATESVSTLVTDIINPGGVIFSYYDENYDGATTTSPLALPVSLMNVRLVKIEFLIDNDQNRSPVPISLTSEVMPRNLKDNL